MVAGDGQRRRRRRRPGRSTGGGDRDHVRRRRRRSARRRRPAPGTRSPSTSTGSAATAWSPHPAASPATPSSSGLSMRAVAADPDPGGADLRGGHRAGRRGRRAGRHAGSSVAHWPRWTGWPRRRGRSPTCRWTAARSRCRSGCADADANPHTEVGRLGLAVNRMLDHIAAALSTRQASESRVRQFVADASHELRTPLAAIRGYTELAQRKRAEVPADVAHAMSRVESEAHRMTHLVEDLLLLARLDSGRPLERATGRSGPVVRRCRQRRPCRRTRSPTGTWRCPPNRCSSPATTPGCIRWWPTCWPTPACTPRPDRRSTLSLTPTADTAVLRVADDGPGIPAALQSEVFERFARADTLALPQGRLHRTGPGHRVGGGARPPRQHRAEQRAGPHRVHGAPAVWS